MAIRSDQRERQKGESSDGSTADAGRLLDGLDSQIANNVDPAELAVRARQISEQIDAGTPDWAHFLLCRGVIDNRLGLPDKALATLLEARQLADRAAAHLKPRISRAISVVHSWRGRTGLAALELLQATAEAHGFDDPVEEALRVAETGRLNLELGRPGAAIVAFKAMTKAPNLPPHERARAMVNLFQALNQLGRHGECLDIVRKSEPGLQQQNARLRFLSLLEEVRALAATGRTTEATQRLEAGQQLIGADETTWEWFEWLLAAAEVRMHTEPEAARRMVEQIAERCREDVLRLREARANLLLGRISRTMGDNQAWRSCAAAALRIAVEESNPRIVEEARSALLEAGYDGAGQEAGQASLLQARYLMGEILGRGGFGIVRRAIDLETGADLAIKLLDLSRIADPAERERTFQDARRELDVAFQVRHPGLVRIHAGFADGDAIVVVQDRVVGSTLRNVDLSNWSRADLIQLFARIAYALGALHAAGLVHRDIKPENVMLRSDRQPVIIDFGLAEVKHAIDRGKSIRGTKGYAAPELTSSADGVPAEPRQDVYAFGVMLSEALAGHTAPARQAPRIVRWLGSLYDRDPLRTLALRLTAPDPQNRPVSMRDVARELEAFLG